MGFRRRRPLKISYPVNETLKEVSEDNDDEQNEVVPIHDPDLTISDLSPNSTESQIPVHGNIVHRRNHRMDRRHLAKLVDADCHEVKGWWHMQMNPDKGFGDYDDSSSGTSKDD